MTNLKLSGFADEAATGIDGQIAAIKELGWNSIELRAVDGVPALKLSGEDFEKAARTLDEAGISVCCLGSGIANWGTDVNSSFTETEEAVKCAVKRMKRLKTRFVRIMSYKVIQDERDIIAADQFEEERIKRLRFICDCFTDNGLTAVHENCHTWGGLSYENTLRLLEAVPGLKLVFDTGNPPLTADIRTPFPYKMQNSLEFYRNVREHIVHVHIKDGTMAADGKTEQYFFPGGGSGHVAEIVTDLEKNGYSGYYSIEPHMEVVFHNNGVQSSEKKRLDNFLEYGRRFESMLRKIRLSLKE